MVTDEEEKENKSVQQQLPNNNKRIVLTEKDVPGASFGNKKPEEYHNEQLKRWLRCRGASVKGNRKELLARYLI